MYKKVAIALMAGTFLAACTTTDPYTGQQRVSRTAGGAALGAGLGAGLGLLAGGNDRRNALIGAGIGALAGGAIGNYGDRQEVELRGTGVSVTRVGNNLVLNMPSNIIFALNQAQIDPSFFATLNSVAIVLSKFNQTLIDVYEFTDTTGSASYNINLSQQRAQSVASYLSGPGHRPPPHVCAGLRRRAPDRQQLHRSRQGAEPPRRNHHRAAHLTKATSGKRKAPRHAWRLRITDKSLALAGGF